MRAVNKLSTILALGLAMLLLRIGPAGAAVFEVRIDTTAISGDVVMAFDFNDSDPDSDHQLVISNFASDGLLYVSTDVDPPSNCVPPVFPFNVAACKDPAGSSVTGTLGRTPSVTISDTVSYDPAISPISYYQRIALPVASPNALPPSISFRFEMSSVLTPNGASPVGGESPDGFAFYLLNPGDVLAPDLNPGGDVLGPGPLILYTFGISCNTEFSVEPESSKELATCTEVRVPSVPEPAPLALTVAALLALISARWRAPALQRRRAVRA